MPILASPPSRANGPRASGRLQAKLKVGPAHDPLEAEADRAAEEAVATSGPAVASAQSPVRVSRKCAACELEDDELRTKRPAGAEPQAEAPGAVETVLAMSGAPLGRGERSFMEGRFQQDFSRVRIHTDAAAAASARSLGAHAYTVADHIVFDSGRYSPQSEAGRRLLAHELAHVVQQGRSAPMVQRWAPCSEANISGKDCPDLEPGERQRAKAGMVFFDGMRDPESERTGALVANFDIGQSSVQASLKSMALWRQFLAAARQNNTHYQLLGFSDCHEAEGGAAAALRRARAASLRQALPDDVRALVDSVDAAPETDCMTTNLTPADRGMNRSVALVLNQTTISYADEADDAIVGKTPQDRLRECEAGARVKTFPFRTTRFGGAPIMAHEENDQIVVKLPMHVKYNSDFRKEVNSLPDDTFLGGLALEKDEIVRVRRYELPHWYSPNLTGDASDDNITEYCIPAAGLLQFAHATNVAFAVNVVVTGIEGLSIATPVGELVGAGASKVAAPVLGAARQTTVAGMLAVRSAAPVLGGEATAAIAAPVADQVVEQSVARTIAPAITEAPFADLAAPQLVSQAAPRIGASTLGAIAPTAGVQAGVSVAGEATNDLVTDQELASFAPAGDFDEGLYATSQRLVRGNLGERMAADALANDGHTILYYKPSILGTNQGGIDIVTMRNGVVNFIDNKALTRSGNVASVSALTTNFNQNLAAMVAEFQAGLADPAISQGERQVLQEALDAIAAGRYTRLVTNANITRSSAVLSGVTQQLQQQGIGFLNVWP